MTKVRINNQGFTLIELMVGIVLTAFMTLGAYTFYINTFFFQSGQEKKKDSQIRQQLALDLLVNDIRSAGFGVIDPARRDDMDPCKTVMEASLVPNCVPNAHENLVVAQGNNTIATTSTFKDVNDTATIPTLGTDVITLRGPNLFIGSLANRTNGRGNQITLSLPMTGTVVKNDVITIGGLFTAVVNDVNGDTITLGKNLLDTSTYPSGTDVYAVSNIAYFVAPNASSTALFRAVNNVAVPVANGIEDLQIAYYIESFSEPFTDAGGLNGVYDAGEAFKDSNRNGTYNLDPALVVARAVSNPTDVFGDGSNIARPFRAIRVSLVSRVADPSPDFKAGVPIAVEDHATMTNTGGTTATTTAGDNFRRSVLTRVVQLLNDGME